MKLTNRLYIGGGVLVTTAVVAISLIVSGVFHEPKLYAAGGDSISVTPSAGTLTGSIGTGTDSATSSGSFVSFQVTMASVYKQWSNGPDPSGDPSWFPIGIFMVGYGGSAPGVPGAKSNTDGFSMAGVNWDEGGYSYDDSYCSTWSCRNPNLPLGISDNANLTNPSDEVWCACDPMGTNAAWSYPPYTSLPLRTSNPALSNVIKANFVTWYDETDANEVNYPAGSIYSAPEVNQAYADIKAADPTRPVQAGYGGCFAKPNEYWGGCGAAQYSGVAGMTTDQALALYCKSPDIVTADDYGNVGHGQGNAWDYGQVVDMIYRGCGSTNTNKIIGADMETGDCCGTGIIPSPAVLQASILDSVMHGAHFVNYFTYFTANDFLGTDAPSMANYQQIKQTDAMIKNLAPWLNAPNIGTVTTTTNGDTAGTPTITCGTTSVGQPIPVKTMLKQYNGITYLLAMTDGHGEAATYPNNQPTIPYSGCTNVTFTLPSAYSGGTATRSGLITTSSVGTPDSGSIPIASNQFTDSFLPYQLHIYRIQ